MNLIFNSSDNKFYKIKKNYKIIKNVIKIKIIF